MLDPTSNMYLEKDGVPLNAWEIRHDGGDWEPAAAEFDWEAHAGLNRLEARTVNAFGVTGTVSIAELVLTGSQ